MKPNPRPRSAYDLMTVRDEILHIFLTVSDDAIYTTVLDLLLNITGSEHGYFAYIDEDGAAVTPSMRGEVWDMCQIPDKSIRFPRETWGDGLWAQALRLKRSLVKNAPGDVPEGHVPIHCALVAPVVYRDEALGYFQLANRQGGYRSEDQQLVDQVCGVMAPLLSARLERDRRQTARVRAEDALRRSEEQYRRLAESTQAVLWEFDLRADRWVYVAPQVARLTGWPSAAWTDLQFWVERVHPDDRTWAARYCEDCTRRGEAHTFEYRFRKSDGNYIWIHDSVTVDMENGEPVRLYGFFVDITERKLTEQAFRQNEARLRSLVDILQHPVDTIPSFLDYVLEQVITLTNSKTGYVRYYDPDRRQVVVNTWSEPAKCAGAGVDLHALNNADRDDIWNQALGPPRPLILNDFTGEFPPRRFGLTEHFGIERLLVVPVVDEGQVVVVVGVANRESEYTDVNVLQLTLPLEAAWKVVEHHIAQAALVCERRLLRTVIDNLPDAIYAKDSEARKILANRVDLRNIGAVSEVEVLGRTDVELFSPQVAEPLMADDLYVLQTGKELRDREERLLDAEGRSRWLLTSKFPLKDEMGQVVGLVGTGREITALKEAEAERQLLLAQIEGQAQQLQRIMETVPQGVLLLDSSGQVLLANPAADRLLDFLDPEGEGYVSRLGDRPLRELLTSPPQGFWHEVQCREHLFEVIAKPTNDNGVSENWVLLINDATRQRQVNAHLQRQERLAAVGQLAAGIAHDFNNIMAVIALHAQMLAQNSNLPDADHDQLQVITGQAKHAAQLIRQILDFSRQSVLDRRPLDLVPLLKEHTKLLKRTLPATIKIQFTCTSDPVLINADPTRIQQLLMNLAINARDAMPQGGELHIGLESVTFASRKFLPLVGMTAGHWIVLTVRDTGTGVPPDLLPRLFEPFFTTKPHGQGTGLGLAQVHGIVGQHDGHIDVSSQLGVGTSFTIYFPAIPLRATDDTSTDVEDIVQGCGEVILVVEDYTALRQALRQMLEGWNYRVLEASNGVAALQTMESMGNEIDVVLSDVVMPDMGGLALVHALNERNWICPVILMSGHPPSHSSDKPESHSVVAWLQKPPDFDQLAEALLVARSPQDVLTSPG